MVSRHAYFSSRCEVPASLASARERIPDDSAMLPGNVADAGEGAGGGVPIDAAAGASAFPGSFLAAGTRSRLNGVIPNRPSIRFPSSLKTPVKEPAPLNPPAATLPAGGSQEKLRPDRHPENAVNRL